MGASRPSSRWSITELGDKRVGFVVDRVIGQHQTVIKTMGHMLKNIDNISGATILGDGTVALILDVYKLISRQNIWNGRDCSKGCTYALLKRLYGSAHPYKG